MIHKLYPWQQPLWQSVQQARDHDHLSHALLFTGSDGCGNGAFIQTLAQGLLCLNPQQGFPCGQCRSCQVFGSRAHPDFASITLLDDKQSILIEQIRELNYFMGLSRSYSPRRVVVISPAERMNTNAANSLLKSLEEPAANTHILLLTSHPATLLPTIRSRCQSMRLPVPPYAEALAWLQQQHPQHDANMLLKAARGRPLEALALDTTDTLATRHQWLQHLKLVAQGQGSITEISAQWEKHDKTTLLDWQLDWVLALARPSGLDASLDILYQLIDSKRLWSIHEQLLELKKLATHPLNPRLMVESMLMLWQVTR